MFGKYFRVTADVFSTVVGSLGTYAATQETGDTRTVTVVWTAVAVGLTTLGHWLSAKKAK